MQPQTLLCLAESPEGGKQQNLHFPISRAGNPKEGFCMMQFAQSSTSSGSVRYAVNGSLTSHLFFPFKHWGGEIMESQKKFQFTGSHHLSFHLLPLVSLKLFENVHAEVGFGIHLGSHPLSCGSVIFYALYVTLIKIPHTSSQEQTHSL